MAPAMKGQGAAPTVVPEPPARTPERVALAKAIEARNYVSVLIAERRAVAQQIDDARTPLYETERVLKERQENLPTDERDRLNALLSRIDPDATDERQQIEIELVEVRKQFKESWEAQRRAEADVRLLEEDHDARKRDVESAIGDVVRNDPSVPAVMQELETLAKRVAILRRACGGVLSPTPPSGGYLPQALLAGKNFTPEGPCPWKAARDRLTHDPDAVLPMPEDV